MIWSRLDESEPFTNVVTRLAVSEYETIPTRAVVGFTVKRPLRVLTKDFIKSQSPGAIDAELSMRNAMSSREVQAGTGAAVG
jgi:hypothetical protein